MNDHNTNYAARHFADALKLYRHAAREMEIFPIADNAEDEAEENRLCDAFCAAEEHLIATEAPDLAGVLAKIEVLSKDGQNVTPDNLAPIIADLVRLGGITASPTFDPFLWLNRFESRGGKVNGDQLSCAADNTSAMAMLARLRPYEREAIAAHQRAHPVEA